MVVISYFLLLYLDNFTISEKTSVPKSLSEILQQLIQHNDFSDNINITSQQTKSENGSNIFDIKTKPNIDKNVHSNNLENISDVKEDELESNFKDTFNDINIFETKMNKEEVQSDNTNSTLKIDYVPKSIEYIMQSDKIVTKEETDYKNDNVNDNLLVESENMSYPDGLLNKAYVENVKNTVGKYEDTNNAIKLRKSLAESDYTKLNILKLNETFEKLFKEVHEIKTLYKNDKILTKEDVKSSPLVTRRFDSSNRKPIAPSPYYNFIMRNVNVMPPVNQNFFRNPYRKTFIINSYIIPSKRVKLLRNYLIRTPLLCCEKPQH